jgi:predicted DNA-binding ribbon-helix-helix protein
VSKRGSPVKKRSVSIGKRKTSFTVEEQFWQALKEIAGERRLPLSKLLADIDTQREHANLSSVIRLFVLDHYRRLAEEPAGEKGRR